MTGVFFKVGPKWQCGRFDQRPICLEADLVVGPICLITVCLKSLYV